MTRKSMLLAGVALAFALAGGAQAQNTAQPMSPKSQMDKSSQMDAKAQKADKDSQKFIKAAIEGNMAEVDVGKLAQEKGKSAAVKKFGQMLIDDHGKANEQAKTAASQVGVEPPSGSSIGEKATYLKLKVLSGDTFDKSFANTMVSDHQSDIKEYQKASGKSDAVGQYAKQALPTLQKHLKEAQALQQELKQQTTGSKQ
jgi:putative membrane protein